MHTESRCVGVYWARELGSRELGSRGRPDRSRVGGKGEVWRDRVQPVC